MNKLPSTLTAACRANRDLQPDNWRAKDRASVFLLLLAVAALTVIAYSPVLFDFFCGDDFVHLTWLSQAVKHPELIWRNFYNSWLDGTTTKFYRPLISLFMVSDYLFWGVNGLGFHITNILFHTTSSIILYFIVASMDKSSLPPRPTISRWGAFASCLFALYPLHAEAVSWITGRVDTIVTTFTLASLLFYLYAREKRSGLWLGASLLAFALALLSKEMAITLPVVMLCYEFCLSPSGNSVRSRLSETVKATFWFWAVLLGYFTLRRLALGTFVGGYDDSLLFIANLKQFVLGWIHGLRMLFVPINRDFLGAHSPLTKMWLACLSAGAILGAMRLWQKGWPIRPFFFLLLWFAASLAPVYKLFAIADDLQGSRLAYLSTAPLCVLMSLGFSIATPKRLRAASLTAGVLTLALAATLLWINNQAWRLAGMEANLIRAALDKFYRAHPGDPPVLALCLPDQIKGAYTCRNSLWGMTKFPQMHRDVSNCLAIDRFEPILPFGYLKQSIWQDKDKLQMLSWNGNSKSFDPVKINTGKSLSGRGWHRDELKTIVIPAPTTIFRWWQDGSLEIRSKEGVRPAVFIDLSGMSCWFCDFISVDLEVIDPGQSNVGGDLLYSNDLNPTLELRQRAHQKIDAKGRQRLIFALHGLPDWALGGRCHQLKLLLPPFSRAAIQGISISPPSHVIPSISFANSGYFGSKGFLHLSSQAPHADLYYRADSVKGAAGAVFEVTRASLLFEEQNALLPSAVALYRRTLGTASGTITLDRKDFPGPGIYQARVWATDQTGDFLGLSGDHIVIAIDP